MTKDSKTKSYNVFISYASKDSDKAKDIADKCKVLGLKTWIDDKEIKAGDKWRDELENTIKSCEIAIVLISKEALSSNWVNKEWSVLCEEKWNRPDIKIIPIILEDTKTPPFLCKYKSYSAEDGNIDYDKLKEYVKKYLGKNYISSRKYHIDEDIKFELGRFADRVKDLKESLQKEAREADGSQKDD